MTHNHAVYDIESYPNIFTFCIGDTQGKDSIVYEISTRKNEFNLLLRALLTLKQQGTSLVGFNNLSYDYPVVHDMLVNANSHTGNMSGGELAYSIFMKSDSIIKSPYGSYTAVYPSEVKIPQIDLMKINHFDNKNRRTSLKCLEFKMRSMHLQDLPFTPGEDIAEKDMDQLVAYNKFDVQKTTDFYSHCIKAIEFRMALSKQLSMDVMNHNDTKIGAEFMVSKLEAELGSDICYTTVGRKKTAKKTIRPEIVLADLIDPRVKFETLQLNAIKDWIEGQVITETKGVFSKIDLLEPGSANYAEYAQDIKTVTKIIKLSSPVKTDGSDDYEMSPEETLYTYRGAGSKARLKKINSEYQPDEIQHRVTTRMCQKLSVLFNDVELVYGLGGLHGSVNNKHIRSDQDWVIVDADVKGYYPETMCSVNAYPEHIGPGFTQILRHLIDERDSYPKGHDRNKALKLGCNGGAYGNSNNKYSPLYDPKVTMMTTINGQLFLSMLIENLVLALGEDVHIIQANTDGITVKVRRTRGNDLANICNQWCSLTKLKLEYAAYNHMYIKDVNNYLAIKQDGSIKAVGDYKDPTHDWAKNHNHLVVYKTAVKCMLNPDLDVEQEIRNHDDLFDFMFYFKASGATFRRLELHHSDEGFEEGEQIQKRSRFLVTVDGARLYKVMAPTAKNPENERHIGEKAGRLVTLCNDLDEVTMLDLFNHIDYSFYVEEVNKLLKFEEV